MRYVWILLISVWFVGCGSTATQTQPRWTQFGQEDTLQSYFALGNGRTLEDAKGVALASIASRISVTVDSTLTKNATLQRQSGESSLKEELKQEVVSKAKQIAFTNVLVVKQTVHEGMWYVLVEVKRDTLFQTRFEPFKQQYMQMMGVMDGLDAITSPFEQLMVAKRSVVQQVALQQELPILQAINPQFKTAMYTQFFTQNIVRLQSVKAAVKLEIIHDENSKALVQLIQEKLSAIGVDIVTKGRGNSWMQVTTNASQKQYKSTNERISNMVFALRETQIEVKNKEGGVVSSRVIKTKAGSSKGFASALQDTRVYEKLIDKEGIIAFITSH